MVTNCFNGIFTKTENNTEMNLHLTLSINSLKKNLKKPFQKFLIEVFCTNAKTYHCKVLDWSSGRLK